MSTSTRSKQQHSKQAFTKTRKWLLPAILLLTAIALGQSLNGDFVNFDDQLYVTDNALVQQHDFGSMITGGSAGNYHPITMISLGLNHLASGNHPFSFHLINWLLHLLNTAFVFLLVRAITSGKEWVAAFTALLFGIHPMHVESVAWISSRKDVLFACFYLLAMLNHWRYRERPKVAGYALTLLFGLLALGAKPAAVTLPFALALLDYLRDGKVQINLLFRHLPLLVLAVIIGWTTVQLQSQDAIGDLDQYSLFEKLGFAAYGIFFYVWKAILPTGLSAMHPYPKLGESWPAMMYASLLITPAMITGWFLLARKNRLILFAGAFFLLNLLLVLQLVSVGRAIAAERYTYLPYIGLFLGLGLLLDLTTKKQQQLVMAGVGVLTAFCLYTTIERTTVWKDSESLWTDVIETYPSDWYAYVGRGNFYRDTGQDERALTDYASSIQYGPQQFRNYFGYGDQLRKMGRLQEAIQAYDRGISVNPNYGPAYVNRGQFLYEAGQTQDALANLNLAVALSPDEPQAFNNRGNVLLALKQTDEAINDYNQALQLKPDHAQAWYNRGNCYVAKQDFKAAVNDFMRALEYDPTYLDAYNNLGNAYFQMGNLEAAGQAFTQLVTLHPSYAQGWLNRSIVRSQLGRNTEALADAQRAKQLGAAVSDQFLLQLGAQ